MRYYIWNTETNDYIMMGCGCCLQTFATQANANDYFVERKLNPAEFRVHEYPQGQRHDDERHAIAGKEYILPIWHDEPWYREKFYAMGHYAHVDRDDASIIHFFENEKKLEREVTTRIKPGKYLKKFFEDVLSDVEIQALTDRHREAFSKGVTLRWAETPDEIEAVYSMAAGFNSCMQRRASSWDCDVHPTRAYGAGDLSIAYISRDTTLLARALVWKDKKKVGRVYGDAALLRKALKDFGIETESNNDYYDTMEGARLLYIPHELSDEEIEEMYDGDDDAGDTPVEDRIAMLKEQAEPGVILPYVDGTVRDLVKDGDYLILTLGDDENVAQFCASHQDGVHIGRPKCSCGKYARDLVGLISSWPTPWQDAYTMNYVGFESTNMCVACADSRGFYDRGSGYTLDSTKFTPLSFGPTDGDSAGFRAKETIRPDTIYHKSDYSGLYYFDNDMVRVGDKRMSHREVLEATRWCAVTGEKHLLEDMVQMNAYTFVHKDFVNDFGKEETGATDLFGPVPTAMENSWVKDIIDSIFNVPNPIETFQAGGWIPSNVAYGIRDVRDTINYLEVGAT